MGCEVWGVRSLSLSKGACRREPVEGSLSKGACFTSRKAAKDAQRAQRITYIFALLAKKLSDPCGSLAFSLSYFLFSHSQVAEWIANKNRSRIGKTLLPVTNSKIP
jgi:hypothetical protein